MGRRIVDARGARDLTQEELADKLGYSPGWIADIERGRRGVSAFEAGRIALALGVSTDQIILDRTPDAGADWLRLQPYWDKLAKLDREFLLAAFEEQLQHHAESVRARPGARRAEGGPA